MAKARNLGAAHHWPSWPRSMPLNSAMSLANTGGNLAAAGAKLMITGHIQWADGGTHDARIIHFRTGNASAPSFTLRASLRDPITSAGPPGRDDGTVDQFGTQVNPAAQTNYSLTLDADRTLAQGELVTVVFDFSAYTSGSIYIALMTAAGSTIYWNRPTVTHFDGTATYTVQQHLPLLTVEAADGTMGIIAGGFPVANASVTTVAINTGTTPDEVAIEFTVNRPLWVGEMGWYITQVAGADFDLVLYDGTTALVTKSFITDTLGIDAAQRWVICAFPDIALTPGNTYRLALKPTTASSVTTYAIDCPSSAHVQAMVGTMGTTRRSDAGAWDAVNAAQLLPGFLGIVASDDGAGSGGGLLTHPGMAGGING